MVCAGTARMTEFEFIQSMADRGRDECRGPLVELSLSAVRLDILETSFQSQIAVGLLWQGLVPHTDGAWLTFQLCAAHWMDLASLTSVRARQYLRGDWLAEASVLLNDVCRAASWDPKEISNLLTWQRVQLT